MKTTGGISPDILKQDIRSATKMINTVIKRMDNIESNFGELEGKIKKIDKFEPEFEEIKRWRGEITSHALQIISITVGLFAIMLAIFIVFIEDVNIEDYKILLGGILTYFIFIFTAWFIIWLVIQKKKN